MNKKLKIVFVSVLDINNRDNWSGTLFYMYKTLKKYADVIAISPLRDRYKYRYIPNKAISKYFFKKNYILTKNIKVCKNYSQQIHKQLKDFDDYDVIFSMGTEPIAYLNTQKPIISFSDSVFKATLNYYEYKTNLTNSQIQQGNEIEKYGLQKCSLAFFSSDWACNYAKEYLDLKQKNKVKKLLFGLNLDNIISKSNLEKVIINKLNSDECNLLFIGKDWLRKGGDIALQCFEYLKYNKNIKCTLTIIGCNPRIDNKDVKIIPYINKNKHSERELYENILKKIHFLILPTRADCSPMVAIESNAFGIPVLIANTGGIPSIIDDGENGYLIDYEADGKVYAKKICQLLIDKNKFKKLCISSREHYELKTNWDLTCKKLIEEINCLLENEK